MYCKNIEHAINIAESIFVRSGERYAILSSEYRQQE